MASIEALELQEAYEQAVARLICGCRFLGVTAVLYLLLSWFGVTSLLEITKGIISIIVILIIGLYFRLEIARIKLRSSLRD